MSGGGGGIKTGVEDTVLLVDGSTTSVLVVGSSVVVIGGAMITVPLGVVEAVVVVTLSGTVVSVLLVDDGVGVGSNGGGASGDGALVSLEVGTVLTVSVVSASATLKNNAKRFRAEPAEVLVGAVVGDVVASVGAVGAELVLVASVLVVTVTSSSVVVASNPGISHTSVRPTLLILPSVL